MIRELVPKDLNVPPESMGMLIDCCTEFVNLLSSESNEISTREKKNTIHPEHVMRALSVLGFEEFVPEVKEAWDSWKRESRQKSTTSRPKGHKTAADAAGFTEEQQIAMQQQLFADARARSNSLQEHHTYVTENPVRETPVSHETCSPSTGVSPHILQNSTIYSELSARADILPIHPLSVPPISSDFQPNVISSNLVDFEIPVNSTSPVQQTMGSDHQVLDLTQSVILLQDGVQHPVSIQTLLSQVGGMLPQVSTNTAAAAAAVQQQQVVQIPDSLPSVDYSFQVPMGSQMPTMQPSFPESIQTSSPQTMDLTNEIDSQNGED
eukprot:g2026.t1